MPRRRRPPTLSSEDAALWRRVTEGVRPLEPGLGGVGETGHTAPPADRDSAPPPVPVSAPAPAVSKPPPERPAPPPPPAAVDQKLVRRIARGQVSVDAVLDLHGLTQRQSYPRLLAFLRDSQAAGHRMVLVITGKGRIDESGDWWEEGARGILRRAVPAWLATPEFRDLVVGHRQAHDRKGGSGAIYVQIRRRRARAGPP